MPKMIVEMKLLTFISILILFSQFCNGQSFDIKIDYDFFLLGTLNDYMGREKYKEIDNRVDEYSQNSKLLVMFLDSVFHDKYPDMIISTNKKTGRLELWSLLLSENINEFYFYKPSGRGAYNGEEDFRTSNLDSLANIPDFFTTYFDTIFTGRIKGDIFKNDAERFSFIAGAYIRFGGEKDSLYHISIANSISKVRVATEQLKDLKCTNVEYIMKKGYLPVGHTVYFTPTEELKSFLKTIKQMLRMHTNVSKV